MFKSNRIQIEKRKIDKKKNNQNDNQTNTLATIARMQTRSHTSNKIKIYAEEPCQQPT